MCLYRCEVEEMEFSVLSADQYSNNPLYGKYGMEIVSECPTEYLESIIRAPLSLEQVSVRQGNRMLIIAVLACLELDYRINGLTGSVIDVPVANKTVDIAIKLLKKDLPMRNKITQALFLSTFTALKLKP